VAITGVLFVMTIARLRRIQTERYQVMNAILDEVLTPRHRQLLPYRDDRIPGKTTGGGPFNRRLSGSYIWTLILMVPTAATGAISLYLGMQAALRELTGVATAGAAIVGLSLIVVCDWLFWRLAEV
jgi:hypothetical protein